MSLSLYLCSFTFLYSISSSMYLSFYLLLSLCISLFLYTSCCNLTACNQFSSNIHSSFSLFSQQLHLLFMSPRQVSSDSFLPLFLRLIFFFRNPITRATLGGKAIRNRTTSRNDFFLLPIILLPYLKLCFILFLVLPPFRLFVLSFVGDGR